MCKAAIERFSTGLAAELYDDNIAVNALSPTRVVPTPGTLFHHLTTAGDPDSEPPSVMAEAALLLCAGDPKALTGRIAYSQQLIAELGARPTARYGMTGRSGWTATCTPSRPATRCPPSTSSPRARKEAGLDAVFITDHNVTAAAADAAARDIGVRVIVGEEVRTPHGDIIGLFLTERIPYVLPLPEVIARIRSQRALVYVPHPFDPARASIGRTEAGSTLTALCAAGARTSSRCSTPRPPTTRTTSGRPGWPRASACPAARAPTRMTRPGVGAAYLEMPDFDGPASFLTALAEARVVGSTATTRPGTPPAPPRLSGDGGGTRGAAQPLPERAPRGGGAAGAAPR